MFITGALRLDELYAHLLYMNCTDVQCDPVNVHCNKMNSYLLRQNNAEMLITGALAGLGPLLLLRLLASHLLLPHALGRATRFRPRDIK